MGRTKNDIRYEMQHRRQEVSQEHRRHAGQAIAQGVDGSAVCLTKRAGCVSIYLSTKSEIPTRNIARAVWANGGVVCVPAWSPGHAKYCLCELQPMMRLVQGKYGIREPAQQIHLMPWDADAFILPGLAFDLRGGRLGYGKGIYDNLLAKANPAAMKIGICYDWQIVDEPLPLEPHDRYVDWVVSDKRIIHCKAIRGPQNT